MQIEYVLIPLWFSIVLFHMNRSSKCMREIVPLLIRDEKIRSRMEAIADFSLDNYKLGYRSFNTRKLDRFIGHYVYFEKKDDEDILRLCRTYVRWNISIIVVTCLFFFAMYHL